MQIASYNSILYKLIFILFVIIISIYIVYEQVTNCLSIEMPIQIERHYRLMAGKSDFYNPWQYRILSPYLVELIRYTLLKLGVTANIDFSFYFIRVFQNIALFFVAYKYYKILGIRSQYLIILGLLLLGYNMSNSVFKSDLSINTYFDILFYLTAGYVILKRKSYWIIPVTVAASFNRETSAFIPLMLLIVSIDFKNRKIANLRDLQIAIFSIIIFAAIFIGLRMHYGMPTAEGIHGMVSPWDYLKFNISFFRMYPQLIGTLGVVPLIVFLRYRSLTGHLKLFFLLIVPLWFLIHLLKSTAVETRLFLVPQALIFVPAFLKIIEDEIRTNFLKLNDKHP